MATSRSARPTALPLEMPIEEAMRTQRAIRRLAADPIDESLIPHLLSDAGSILLADPRRE